MRERGIRNPSPRIRPTSFPLLWVALVAIVCLSRPLPVAAQWEMSQAQAAQSEEGAGEWSEEGRIRPGARLRVTSSFQGGRPLEGWLDATDGDWIVLLDDRTGELQRIAIGDISEVEVRTARNGKKSGATIGSIVGGLVGLAAGFVVGQSTVEDCGSSDWFCFDDLERGAYAVLGGLIGSAAGAALGYAAGPTGWEVISTERLRTAVVASRSGNGLHVSVGQGTGSKSEGRKP